MIKIELPPALSGSPDQQLAQMKSYLYRVAELLNNSLNNLSSDNFQKDALQAMTAGGGISETEKQEIQGQYSSLKGIIQKTATEVYQTIEQLETDLSGTYVARSEFGTYTEATNQQIVANSTAIQQNFTYFSEITDGMVSQDEFSSYQTQVQAYIRSGLLDDSGTPIYGVEIGQLGDTPLKVRIVSDRISFYSYSDEVAFISNNSLYITTARITKALTLGNWQIDANTPVYGGLSFKWVVSTGTIISGEYTPAGSMILSTTAILTLGESYEVSISGGDFSYVGTLVCRQDAAYMVLGDAVLDALGGTGDYGFSIYFTGSGVGLAVSTQDVTYSVSVISTKRGVI